MGAAEPVRPLTGPSPLALRTLRAVRVLSLQALQADSLRARLDNLLPARTSAIRISRNSLEVAVVVEVVEAILTTP